MATRTWRGTTSTASNVAANYLELAVPTSADDIVLDGTFVNPLIVVSTLSCLSFNSTLYTGAITINAALNIANNFTIGASVTSVTGTNTISVSSTATIVTNGISIACGFSLTGIVTYTITGIATITGTTTISSGGGTTTINGSNLSIKGNLITGTGPAHIVTGTSKFIFDSVTNVNTTGGPDGATIQNEININTGAAITLQPATELYIGGVFTHNGGTITSTGCDVYLVSGASVNAPSIHWDLLHFDANSTVVQPVDLNVYGTCFLGVLSTSNIINANNVNIYGNCQVLGAVTGTAKIRILGTCTYSGTGTLENNIEFDSGANTVTFSGTFRFKTGLFKYISGTTITAGSTFNISGAATIDVNSQTIAAATTTCTTGINFNNISNGNSYSVTLSSPLRVCGNITTSANSIIYNGSTFYLMGSISVNNMGVGTTNFVYQGSGTWTGLIGGNFTIDTTGLLYVGGSSGSHGVTASGKNFTVTSGEVLGIFGTIFQFGSGTITTLSSTKFYGLTLVSTSTLASDMYCDNFAITSNFTISGSYNIYVNRNATLTASLTLVPVIRMTGHGTIDMGGSDSLNARLVFESTCNLSILNYLIIGGTGSLECYSDNVKCDNDSVELKITGTANSFIGMNRIAFPIVTITAGRTVTMDEFFSGTPRRITSVQSSTTSNYIITFTETKKRISKFVKVSNCTLNESGRLIILTRGANKGDNIGVQYINQMTNSLPMNGRTRPDTQGFLDNSFNGFNKLGLI